MNTWQSLIDKFDDFLNPIIVKELRQVVRGRFFWGVLILFLGIQCAVLSFSIADKGITRINAGAETLTFLFAFLFFASVVLIPLHSGFRFARERKDGGDELLFITTITPHTIIRGKFAATLAFILLLFSAFAPFMALTFFLSGVDFGVTFFILAFGFLASVGSSILQICFGSLARDANAMQFFRIAGGIVQIITFFTLQGMASDVIRGGYGRLINLTNFTESILTILVVFALATYFLYVSAASVIFPAGSNRMRPVRKAILITWLTSLAICIYWVIAYSDANIFYMWAYLSTFVIGIFYAVSVSERDYLTERVASEIPAGFFAKVRSLFMFSGAAGGLLFCALLQILTFVFSWLGIALFASIKTKYGPEFSDFAVFSFAINCFFLAYSLLAAFIRRIFLSSFIDIHSTWVIAMLVAVILAILPMFATVVFGGSSSMGNIGSPLSITSNSSRDIGMILGFGILFVGLIINSAWIIRQIREFLQTPTYSHSIDQETR